MKAAKIQAKIDTNGHLIASEPVNLPPGEVEVIILEKTERNAEIEQVDKDSSSESSQRRIPSRTKIFQEWFANSKPVSSNFDPEQAKWEALKEKYDL
ncbi:MAG: hypothetical protein SAL07_02195 [Oscillatoria sp. PMC 1051.18]|nr:hypothetical protein [Oscillatoria sp. PMC 1050.18]MEC5028697.1 hypothetical protein [Oscillatoria sp. PMC 1051.18]